VRLDDDYDVREPRPKRRRSSSKAQKGSRFRFLLALDPKRLARYAAISLSVGIALGIVVNALMLQKGRHPAPLFGQSFALGETRAPVKATPPAPRVADDRPLPPARPTPQAVDTSSDAGAAHDPVAAEPSPRHVDVIAQLIAGGPIPDEGPSPKTIMGVQKALAALGFTVKATGTFGPQTHKALAAFQRDHHLPVSDTLSHRLIKVLAAESKMKITY
jgi:hypothetical protein